MAPTTTTTTTTTTTKKSSNNNNNQQQQQQRATTTRCASDPSLQDATHHASEPDLICGSIGKTSELESMHRLQNRDATTSTCKVLPNVLARPFGTAQQGVDNSFAKVGVLRNGRPLNANVSEKAEEIANQATGSEVENSLGARASLMAPHRTNGCGCE
eukprot:2135230-Amphidinium_carterae.1